MTSKVDGAGPNGTLFLFLDTNSLLHYPPLRDIDWHAITGHKLVSLILCLQVIHELDEKKDDPRLGERASRVIKEVKAIRAVGGAVRDGVTLDIFNYEIRSADFPETLSFDSKDDRIVHSAKKYQNAHPGAHIAVCTEDMGMSLRCEAHGILVVAPDTRIRLDSPNDELTKKYRQAVSELNSLKNRLPHPVILIANAGQAPEKGKPFTAILQPNWQPVGIQTELAKIKTAYPKMGKPMNSTLQIPSIIGPYVSDEDRQEYNQRLENFYSSYELYLERLNTWGESKDRVIQFDLWLGNSGGAPADDIDVFLLLPQVIKWVAESKSDSARPLSQPEPPKPPDRPKPRPIFGGGIDLNYLAGMPPLSTQIADLLAKRERDLVEVGNEQGKGFRIHGKVKRLKHGSHHHVGTFLAVFGCWDDVKPFDAEYWISASELPDRLNGKIPFVVKQQEAIK